MNIINVSSSWIHLKEKKIKFLQSCFKGSYYSGEMEVLKSPSVYLRLLITVIIKIRRL